MTKNEFEALLKIEDKYLMMCTVSRGTHTTREALHAADVVNARHDVVMDGIPAKTSSAAIQKTIARYYKQNANHR